MVNRCLTRGCCVGPCITTNPPRYVRRQRIRSYLSRAFQALPPALTSGVSADSSYDAEGISLVADPDESESMKNSDNEEDESTKQGPPRSPAPLHELALPSPIL